MEGDNQKAQQNNKPAEPMRKLIVVASIAAGVQFGWALQLSLLTPYVQLLGIPHTWSAYIWLCGPISGLLVQPIVGYYSDRCQSRFGRRTPFIAAGAALVASAVFFIGFAADIGHAAGDQLGEGIKIRAISIFVAGFWILDVANNMLQGPCRAFLADLSNGDSSKMRAANAAFSFFMALGNVLGYAAGSYDDLHKIFPFSQTKACDKYCANLKSCFFLAIALLITLTTLALTLIKEEQYKPDPQVEEAEKDEAANTGLCMNMPFFSEIFNALKELSRPMWFLLLVTCLNWVAWFPFLLFDTDWMGKEVYGGDVSEGKLYNQGVHAGALGLMIYSITLGITSLGIGFMAKIVGGVKQLWGIINFLLAICLAMTVLITKMAESSRHYTTGPDGTTTLDAPEDGIKIAALALFGVIGIPQAITFSIPFALASIFSSKSGAGQGLSLGVLNLAIVVPQMFVSCFSGPLDAMFGGGNLPAFVAGSVFAVASGICAFTLLPTPPADAPATKSLGAAPSFH